MTSPTLVPVSPVTTRALPTLASLFLSNRFYPIDIIHYDTYTGTMEGDKALFIIGLLILASGIGTLAFGLTVTHVVLELYEVPIKVEQGDPVFISIGAGLLALGAGMLIGSIVWKLKQ